MANHSEDALNKLTKPDLVDMILKLYRKMESVNDTLVNEVHQFNENFKKLEADLAISRNAKKLLSNRLVAMEKQCWDNVQYFRRECLEVVGIPNSVKDENLEEVFCKIIQKTGVNVEQRSRDVPSHWKNGRVIVKFTHRKDCQQVLNVKKGFTKPNKCRYISA